MLDAGYIHSTFITAILDQDLENKESIEIKLICIINVNYIYLTWIEDIKESLFFMSI